MKNKINILFLGGAKRVSMANFFITAGKELKKEVCIFSYELDPYVPIASVGKVIIGKKWADKDVVGHLLEIINENNINIVIPFVDPSISVIAQLKKKNANVFSSIPEEKLCEIMFDKVLANEWFLQYNIPVPSNNSGFPIVAKPRKGSASVGIIKLKNQSDLDWFLANHKQEDYLIQQWIDAHEYSVDAYVSEQSGILSVVPRRRLEVAGGEATKSITEKNIQIIDLSKKILSYGRFIGPVTLQFLKEKNSDKVYLMEINTRLGGGVVTSIEAGANCCMMLLNDYMNIAQKLCEDWKENLIMTRTFKEYYFYANNN